MGTNFYARIIPTKERIGGLKNIIESDDWDKILEEIHYTFDSFKPISIDEELRGEIHLGKRSGGWKFLWNSNIYRIRNGHSEKIQTGENSYLYNWIEEPDTYYYIYPLTKKGIKEFIDRPDVEIYDEYGEKQDKEDFFDMALGWTTWKNKEAWDSKSYHKWEESQGHKLWIPRESDENVQILKKCGFNVEWPYSDFYSDGLRFSINTDFS